jgi:hypothetical protein
MMDATDDVTREEYLMMVNQIFGSEEQGYEHYNSYVKEKGFSVRLDNFFTRYKKKRILGRDAEFVLNHMKVQVERDAEFFFKHTTDDEGHLRNLF